MLQWDFPIQGPSRGSYYSCSFSALSPSLSFGTSQVSIFFSHRVRGYGAGFHTWDYCGRAEVSMVLIGISKHMMGYMVA